METETDATAGEFPVTVSGNRTRSEPGPETDAFGEVSRAAAPAPPKGGTPGTDPEDRVWIQVNEAARAADE